MPRALRRTTLLALLLGLAAACSEGPTAPPTDQLPSVRPEPSIITPFLLPSGADWGLYFGSFNPNRALNARVIHYPSGAVAGNGYFTIPRTASGVLRITSADPYDDCIPNSSPCGTVTNVPESAVTTGTALLISGRRIPFTLDLHSNYWPNPTNTYDTATLSLCYSSTNCVSYSFYGELHHEPQ
jgi:hypothetical protein